MNIHSAPSIRPDIRRRILVVTIVVEGLLAAGSIVWSQLRTIPLPIGGSPAYWVAGVAASLPLFLINRTIFERGGDQAWLKQCLEFKEKFVVPLARELDDTGAIVIAVMAGVGEELFFRGVLQHEVGIALSSAIFSVIHFGLLVREYWFVVAIYFLVSIYFAFLYAASGMLIVPILAHVVYDWLVLRRIRRSLLPA